MLMIDKDVAVMGGPMLDEEIVQDIQDIDTVEQEVPEIRKAIDTLINYSMFRENGEIWVVAMMASTLFEKELCDSLKQASISDFFKKC